MLNIKKELFWRLAHFQDTALRWKKMFERGEVLIYAAKPTCCTEQVYPGHTKFYEKFVA